MGSALRARTDSSSVDAVSPAVNRGHDVEIVIRPALSTFGVDLRELWQFRHLFAALVWRNVRVEFDATRLGRRGVGRGSCWARR